MNSDEVSILVASDWAPIRAFDPVIRRDPAAVYGDMLPVLRAADLRIVNCECALTAASESVWKSGAVFKGLPAHAAGLTAVPFEVACLANNHVFDYGIRGFRETLGVLRRNGVFDRGRRSRSRRGPGAPDAGRRGERGSRSSISAKAKI